jgi:hypothetical protein
VIEAFEKFMRITVNLEPGDTVTARASRDWLMGKIDGFPLAYDDFPLVVPARNIEFGSFARRTKIRPLDDIDLISGLHADGCTYLEVAHDNLHIYPTENSRMYRYLHDGATTLSSTKVVNRYVRALENVPQYREAKINRRGEAATLKLTSYDWNFDVVPAFHTVEDEQGRSFYVIPNGNGHWKKTDPRIDRDRVLRVNTKHDGNMLGPLRAIKYWHRRPTMPTMSSYALECMIVQYYENKATQATEYVDIELVGLFSHIADAVLDRITDPKGIQDDLNDLTYVEKLSVRTRALLDAERAREARAFETNDDHKSAIETWTLVFGANFPEFA